MKTFIVQVTGNPGYSDRGSIVDDDNLLLWHGQVSCSGIPFGEYPGHIVATDVRYISLDDTAYSVRRGPPADDCVTIPPEDGAEFFWIFASGEEANIILVDYRRRDEQ